MLILEDNESKSIKKLIKYSDNFESVVLCMREKDIEVSVTVGDDRAIFELRNKDHVLLHRDIVKFSELSE